jgi:ssDNA-binding Zn-finger/Zn-ribbon topoisomerase 1
MTQYRDQQPDGRTDRRRREQEDASRRSMLARQCPTCGRSGALKRTIEEDGSLRLVCQREPCGYRRVVPLECLHML